MKTYCTICKIETNQKVVHETEKTIYYDPLDDYYIQCYQIIECDGCNNFSYRTLSRDKLSTELSSIENTSPWKLVKTFPLNSKNHIVKKEINNLPEKIKGIYSETIISFNNNCFILCAAGIRSIIESIYTDKIKSEKDNSINLKKKINKLAEDRILTKINSEILHSLRFIGNKALHELELPDKKELIIAIEIIEITLNVIYHIESISKKLRNTN